MLHFSTSLSLWYLSFLLSDLNFHLDSFPFSWKNFLQCFLSHRSGGEIFFQLFLPENIFIFPSFYFFKKTLNFILEYIQLINGASLVAPSVKESACSAEDADSISGSGRSPGEGHGNSLQYSCLGNSKDRGAWRATVHGVAKELDTTS